MQGIPDCIGRPQHEAEALLEAAGLSFEEEITRPTRDFFKTNENYLYVLRERKNPEGSLQFVLAACCAGMLPV